MSPVLICKATISSYNAFVVIRIIGHLRVDKLQRYVHSSGTVRKIPPFLPLLITSPRQLVEKDILARNFALLVEYYCAACKLPVGIYDPYLYYLGDNKTFLSLKGSGQC